MSSNPRMPLYPFISIQSQSSTNSVPTPPPTHQQSKTSARHKPSIVELDELTFGNNTKNGRSSIPKSGMEDARTPNELEIRRPPSPMGVGGVDGDGDEEGVGAMQSWNDPPINRWRVLSCCLCYFGNGMNDSGKHTISKGLFSFVTSAWSWKMQVQLLMMILSNWSTDPVYGDTL